jgi:hypothetical protein
MQFNPAYIFLDVICLYEWEVRIEERRKKQTNKQTNKQGTDDAMTLSTDGLREQKLGLQSM